MALPPGWKLPSKWSAAERETFRTLRKGEDVNKLTPDERKILNTHVPGVVYRSIPIIKNRPFKISGVFLAEIIRKYASEFPIGVKIKGAVIEGEIQVENVQIDKLVSLEHCYFTGPFIARGSKFLWFSLTGSVLENYFDMRSSVISGGVFLRWGFKSLTCTLLRDTTVTGPVDCTGALFKFNAARLTREGFAGHAAGESFSLSRASMSALFWEDIPDRPEGIVNLRCRIGSFRDNIKTADDVARDWPARGCLRISGLKYDDRTSTEPAALLAWLDLQKVEKEESRYASFQTVIKVLLDAGHEISANEIIVAKQHYIAGREQSVLNRTLRYIYIGLSRAGIGTDRIAFLTAVAFAVSLVIVVAGGRSGQFIPKSTEILKDACFDISKTCPGWTPYGKFFQIPSYYPKFNSIGYTVDLFVPGISYGVSADWRPRDGWMTAVTLVIRALGLLFTGLLVVCVSGIARFSR